MGTYQTASEGELKVLSKTQLRKHLWSTTLERLRLIWEWKTDEHWGGQTNIGDIFLKRTGLSKQNFPGLFTVSCNNKCSINIS